MLLISNIFILKTLFPLLAFLLAWEMVWKWIALFKAWKKWDVRRFLCLFIFNTCGILPIIYLLIDSTKKDNDDSAKQNHKISTKTKETKKITKGGVLKWKSSTKGTGIKSKKK
jgi:hypothetical protein